MTEAATGQNQDKRSKIRVKPVRASSVLRKWPGAIFSGGKRDDSRPQHKPVLQRRCACGQHTIGGGSCSVCSNRHLTSLSAVRKTEDRGGENLTVPFSQSFYRDFNWVPANSFLSSVSASQRIGGEGADDGDQEALIGGENKSVISTVSQRTDHSLQREGEGEGSSATLSITTVTAPTNLGCGGFRDQVRWTLDGASESTNGFVVQKVTFDLLRERCDGGDSNLQTTYWEAWQVRQGKIFIGTSESSHNADTFQVPPAPGHRGSCYEAGWAKFIPDYEEPHGWGNVPQARSLPSTTSEPAGWSDSGTTHRFMRSTFDCCGQTDPGEFDFGGSSNA